MATNRLLKRPLSYWPLIILRALALFLIPLSAFGATDTYVCEYPTYSDKDGSHRRTDQFTLTFVVDRAKGSGYIVGNQGSAKVQIIPGLDRLAFIEVTDTGNVMTTTILSDGESVHSRNTVIIDHFIASQSYGRCVHK